MHLISQLPIACLPLQCHFDRGSCHCVWQEIIKSLLLVLSASILATAFNRTEPSRLSQHRLVMAHQAYPAIARSHMAKKAQLLGIWLRALLDFRERESCFLLTDVRIPNSIFMPPFQWTAQMGAAVGCTSSRRLVPGQNSGCVLPGLQHDCAEGEVAMLWHLRLLGLRFVDRPTKSRLRDAAAGDVLGGGGAVQGRLRQRCSHAPR